MSSKLDMELYLSDDPSEVGFAVRTRDGLPLSPQDILDAVVEALTQEFGFVPQPVPKLDS